MFAFFHPFYGELLLGQFAFASNDDNRDVLPAPDVRVSEKKKIKSVIKEGRSIEC